VDVCAQLVSIENVYEYRKYGPPPASWPTAVNGDVFFVFSFFDAKSRRSLGRSLPNSAVVQWWPCNVVD